jgi:hypothetical protein
MSVKKAKRRGRPALPAAERKAKNFTFRSRGNLHEQLQEAAVLSGRSISEEIERRLQQSFADDEQRKRDNRLSQLLMRDHAMNVLLKGGQGASLLDWIAFKMIELGNWETSVETRHGMANLISEKVLRDWPKPEGED